MTVTVRIGKGRKNNMKAIYDLEKKLTENGIPHSFREEKGWGCQIIYPNLEDWEEGKTNTGDVVCNRASYGHKDDLMEAMGFDINCEKDGDDVVGFLTVEMAYEYFRKAWEKDNANA